MEIGPLIVELRRDANLSQKEVASALGISPSYLSDMERGRRPFQEDRANALPEVIRAKVVAAVIANLHERIDRLRASAAEDAVRST